MKTSRLILYIVLCVALGVALGILCWAESSLRGAAAAAAREGFQTQDTELTAPFIILYDQEPEKALPVADTASSAIPKTIWTFWEGPENRVVSYCIDSWKYYNPDYEVVVLNKANYRQYVGAGIAGKTDVDALRHSGDGLARYSDYVRCMVLSTHGGIWIDSSIICHAPLAWVHAYQQRTGAEFVGYYIHKGTYAEFRAYSPMIENWFFACVPGCTFMRDWSTEFFKTDDFARIDDYLDSVRAAGTHFNNMPNIGSPDYLTMHIAGQHVLQRAKDAPKYRLCLFSACDGPFKYLHDVDWDVATAVNRLMSEPTRSEYFGCTLVKLRSIERNTLEQYDDAQKRRAFSNLA
jgi:hypothetical protein